MDQNDRVALITGANRGIGLETARQLGSQGITVLLGARDSITGEAAATELRAAGIDARALKLDVTQQQDRNAAVQFIQEHFGKLDILVNNAAIFKECWGVNRTISTPAKVLEQTFATNFFAPVALTQALLPLLLKSPAARIVNVSSQMGSLTMHSDPKAPIYNNKPFAYDASKTALNAFTVHLAHQLRNTKIKVNSVHPGWVKTELGTNAAPMSVEEGAKTPVAVATLPEDGPTGGYIYKEKTLPW